jgi:hypothetical protein
MMTHMGLQKRLLVPTKRTGQQPVCKVLAAASQLPRPRQFWSVRSAFQIDAGAEMLSCRNLIDPGGGPPE